MRLIKNTESISGLLINNLSVHKIIFTFLNDKSYLVIVDKFIDIEKPDERSMNNFINELKALNIYDQLDIELTGDPNENYQLLSSRLNAAREIHMLRKRVKYEKVTQEIEMDYKRNFKVDK